MAGYSGTPLAQKLGIKAGSRLLLVNAPKGAEDWLAPLPEDVRRCGTRDKNLDVIVLFETRGAALTKAFQGLAARLNPAGGFWVSWPKKSSGVETDLDENKIRAIGLAHGLVDNKVCAVSGVWSGLRFVYRVKDRPAPGCPARPIT